YLEDVRNCVFSGDVRISMQRAEIHGEEYLPLLLNSVLDNTTISAGCRIENSGTLRNLFLKEGCVIENCGRISFQAGCSCGSGSVMELGVETGERIVPAFPGMNVDLAELLSGGKGHRERMDAYRKKLAEFLKELRQRLQGSVGKRCRLASTPLIENCFLGSGTVIDNACAVRNSTLMGGDHGAVNVSDGALVRDSIIRWKSRVDSMAIVESSVVDEACTVEKHGKLTASYLGPNSVLGEGEITSSLAGPFTAAHHQSLLIAARWPEGKGNIGYGANVGSNHTSRLPDQEIRPGEGQFFGLACSIKFPADFSMAPYSIIATGVTTLPQRVEFPFSLICKPFQDVQGIPPAFNQIVPAWVLSDNMFAVRRNDRKYLERNRAAMWKPGEEGSIRRDTAVLMQEALKRLESASGRKVYTSRQISGLGKNYLTEPHRLKAVETYRFHLRLFALEGLAGKGDTDELDEFRKQLLLSEFPGVPTEELLSIRDRMREEVQESVAASRRKDSVRGERTIEDYGTVRKPPEED
ncbi:MAG: DUF4954 family protein, partial [Candidatus Aegiribacteria sp.]|nr:DUF4954 family protein [Candidatus Aegiribacteria sp.]MBD3294062.1 DUF4954 family protein [Candidatus Fermentibacteria bacterium]